MRQNSFTDAVIYEQEQRKDSAFDRVRGPPGNKAGN